MEGKFFDLVHFLYIICWQTLGKLPNPETGKTEKNLMFAKSIIDILETLQEKTKGNLSDEERKTLENALTDLRLNYVDELNKKDEQKESKPDEKAKEGP